MVLQNPTVTAEQQARKWGGDWITYISKYGTAHTVSERVARGRLYPGCIVISCCISDSINHLIENVN